MKEHYSTILLGAGYYALGYASSHSDCLILEESQMVGVDFHSCLHPVRLEQAPENAVGDIMREYGVWKEDGFDLLNAQMVVHEYASRKLADGMELLLDCRIISAEQRKDGVRVSFITNQGISDVTADRLIDTTADCISQEAAVRCVGKTLNAFSVAMEDHFAGKLKRVCPECLVTRGPLENEMLICFPTAPEVSLTDAYREMVRVWSMAFPHGEEKILFVAENFDAVYEAVAQKPPQWVGRRFLNPMAAFEEGAMAK